MKLWERNTFGLGPHTGVKNCLIVLEAKSDWKSKIQERCLVALITSPWWNAAYISLPEQPWDFWSNWCGLAKTSAPTHRWVQPASPQADLGRNRPLRLCLPRWSSRKRCSPHSNYRSGTNHHQMFGATLLLCFDLKLKIPRFTLRTTQKMTHFSCLFF